LPERVTDPAAGVTVRFVFPGSPASSAGIQAGDQLRAIEGVSLASLDAWLEAIALHQPGDEVTITYQREGTESEVRVKLATLPEQVPPDDIPTAIQAGDHPTEDNTAESKLELVTLKVPEQSNECFALLPPTAAAQTPVGVVIWLPNPKKFDEAEFRQRWESVAADYGLIVLAPQPQDTQRWQPTELEFIRKIVDQVTSQYAIDPTRVVAFGQLAGGSLAYRFAMQNRDVVRAIVTVDAALPTGLQLRANDPVDRLAFIVAFGEASSLASAITKDVAKLREMKFPVTVINWAGDSRALEDEEMSQVARWIDTLDRL
jgi:membrane-associated protease RseP (regulator of RpoE activity)